MLSGKRMWKHAGPVVITSRGITMKRELITTGLYIFIYSLLIYYVYYKRIYKNRANLFPHNAIMRSQLSTMLSHFLYLPFPTISDQRLSVCDVH